MNRSIIYLLFVPALALTLITGCLPGGDQPVLTGSSWKLISYAGNQPLPETEITAEFEGDQIRGSAGCNQYFGSYSARGEKLTVEQLAWTEMACLDPEGVMEQEQRVMALLSQADSYQISSNRLQITTSVGSDLIFESTD